MNIIIAVESLTGIFPFEQNHTHKFSYAKDKFFSIYYYDSLQNNLLTAIFFIKNICKFT
ncbi:hypothetical protein PFMC_02639 [Plasmodium falciparum CAMP/Malaysia]|uniref:Uncharacterized protein n=1 Tax=Plasmodium falciparum (isolate Camp / Malaysia) TaxID=5835 RepID=A0A024X8M8_PLAFC|nr:hypothetical protein PFMC_02639 [Plasmodium falciparum CAMP/Malaysia]